MDITNSDICQHKSSCAQVYHKIINIHADAPHTLTHARMHERTYTQVQHSVLTTQSLRQRLLEAFQQKCVFVPDTSTKWPTPRTRVKWRSNCSSHPRVIRSARGQLGRPTTSTLRSAITNWCGRLTRKFVLSCRVGSWNLNIQQVLLVNRTSALRNNASMNVLVFRTSRLAPVIHC